MKLSRTATALLSVALLSFLVTDIMAQDGDRPRGDGGDRGAERGDRDDRGGPGGGRDRARRGGPGGGPARGPGGGPGRGGDPAFGLLMNEKVREEIELMPDQEEALVKIREQSEQRGERPDFNFREASEQDRQKFFEQMQARRAEMQQKIRDQLEEVLLPEQLERLEQIALQMRGVGALSDEKVAQELEITAEQKKQLEETRESIRGSMQERMRDPEIRELFASRDREAIQKAFAKVREDFERQMLGILTSEQQKAFEEMKGEPFELPEGFARFAGGGRGGPGGGPGFGGRDRGPRGGPGGGGGPDRRRGGGERQRPAVEE